MKTTLLKLLLVGIPTLCVGVGCWLTWGLGVGLIAFGAMVYLDLLLPMAKGDAK